MNIEPNVKKWFRTSVLAGLGGGIAGAFAAATDATKYNFPHDLGSGKLWKFFFMGAAITFGGLLIKSPFGQQMMGAYKQSQEDLAASQAALEETKAALKAPMAEVKSPSPPKKP
jgi:hypothetical protein